MRSVTSNEISKSREIGGNSGKVSVVLNEAN